MGIEADDDGAPAPESDWEQAGREKATNSMARMSSFSTVFKEVLRKRPPLQQQRGSGA
jgi:hypothetical protein